ncbi:LodA/GoxA family CTQ-dependent oxidase [Teredinibacter sp. KSP-S5-2]|uniref:LodA/GoxA family CTQ-dependent oxidase n=1 Tax=Teredinibacter sp. KSP-S5-2 TaxID=3034506 RepID=UPI0029347119|nr:LodA/GoxA family CTQ-dependent oxidase [Teredinibacter sp. KSP-S5-2]WNO09951.1 LodA/GoxA family CTQ-dependent oxidase [Teredinibacter sp. KSP-S5-2]
MTQYFRVHPNINFTRVGSSDEYYIAPETAAGEIVNEATGLFGGLPIKPGTEDTPIQAGDLRDAKENPKRQAARFRIFAYDQPQAHYPGEDPGREITIGSKVGNKVVKDILWTVHVANKKNNNYSITDSEGQEIGILAYENGQLPPVRNKEFGTDLNSTNRLSKLVIDPGPRAIASSTMGKETLAFDDKQTPSYYTPDGKPNNLDYYPVSFPDQHFDMFNPLGKIDSLGEVTIEANTGRLIVTGGYGKASAIMRNNTPPPLTDAIDNDDWFDDVSDGPVQATILFEDGSTEEAIHGWVVCTDPGYAPQTRNVVSTWDDIYNTWVENLNLVPQMFQGGQYQQNYQASFNGDVLPVFHAAFLQRWNTNLPKKGVQGHEYMASITPSDDPKAKLPSFEQLIRDPNNTDEDGEGVKMPLSLGDATKSFLSVSPTQYFLLNQWYQGKYDTSAPAIGAGEKLDKVVLENCLGGRYSPGIELTFIVRDTNLYIKDWQGATGPFRINLQPLDYNQANKNAPFLQQGYIPLRTEKVEPGDLSKFMSQPWHTDYNSCATHTPDPNPAGNNTLYWSWPAQRPVNVHPASECTFDKASGTWNLGGQLYSVRGDEGEGTSTPYPQQQGRYQCYFDFVENWHKVGFIIQGLQIPASEGENYGANKFLETASLYKVDGDLVQPWPTATEPGYKSPTNCGPKS